MGKSKRPNIAFRRRPNSNAPKRLDVRGYNRTRSSSETTTCAQSNYLHVYPRRVDDRLCARWSFLSLMHGGCAARRVVKYSSDQTLWEVRVWSPPDHRVWTRLYLAIQSLAKMVSRYSGTQRCAIGIWCVRVAKSSSPDCGWADRLEAPQSLETPKRRVWTANKPKLPITRLVARVDDARTSHQSI